MNKIVLLLLITFSTASFCQEREATILFNDSTSVKGFAEVKNEKIYFRVSLTAEKSEWSYDMAYGLLFTGYGFLEKYIYVKPGKYAKKPKLMEVIEEGTVNLYKESDLGYNVGIGVSASKSTIGAAPTVTYGFSTTYFVKRKSEAFATDISFSFKSNSSRYFSDCKALVEKIKKREFTEKDIVDIVYYYNDYCGTDDED